ncbi:class I SAM-dependent methyltransferase [Mariniblastus sp.]|nr:class I SAM-dependent methyltransferase [Mariniblastus sp.]
MNQPTNPITGNTDVFLVDTFEPDRIVSQYKEELGLDVQRYFADIKVLNLFECSKTGYRFFYPFDLAGDGDFYGELSGALDAYYPERWEHRLARDHLVPNDRILEIGCGSGQFLELVRKKGAESQGIELSIASVDTCLRRDFSVELATIEQYSQKTEKTFSAICFFQVLEHVSDISGFMNSVKTVVEPGGKIMLSVPNNNPYLFKYDKYHTLNCPPHHMGLWNKKSLIAMGSQFGLNTTDVKIEPNYMLKRQFGLMLEQRPSLAWLKPILNLTPRKLLRLFANFFEGRNIFVVYQVPE